MAELWWQRAEEVIRSPVMMPTSKAKAKAKAPAKTKAKHGGMKPAETQRQPGQVLAWQQMDAVSEPCHAGSRARGHEGRGSEAACLESVY